MDNTFVAIIKWVLRLSEEMEDAEGSGGRRIKAAKKKVGGTTLQGM